MFKSFSILVAVLLTGALISAVAMPERVTGMHRAIRPLSSGPLVLSAKNTISFNSVVTQSSVAAFQVKLMAMSHKLKSSDVIIVVMDTPGGDVEAGLKLIDSIKAIPQEVKTLTVFSASMGFQIVQNAGERMILPNGTLMSHRASGGIDGTWDGNLETRLAYFHKLLDRMSQKAADRMGLTLQAYKDLVREEYWVNGDDAVAQKAADTVVLARCDESLEGTEYHTVPTMFGEVHTTFSKCPLITSPVAMAADSKLSATAQAQAKAFVWGMYNHMDMFVKNYIETGKYKEFHP